MIANINLNGKSRILLTKSQYQGCVDDDYNKLKK